jgi:carbon monoxide dehydrogenase subunit G
VPPPIIRYERTFDFDLSPSELWEALQDPSAFERWWPWLKQFEISGGVIRTGAVMRGTVTPPLPYRMRIEVDLVRVRRPGIIDGEVHGDLEGQARIRLRKRPSGTAAEVAWSLEMMQRPMRIASAVAYPLLVRAHDAVVEMTVESFRRRLADGR